MKKNILFIFALAIGGAAHASHKGYEKIKEHVNEVAPQLDRVTESILDISKHHNDIDGRRERIKKAQREINAANNTWISKKDFIIAGVVFVAGFVAGKLR
ncbi:hypothetical protein HYX58_03730 [Candidatus Dependentiae bacterium]|nr:hypothetical protein [Candidatus Dependentiae bacterium]